MAPRPSSSATKRKQIAIDRALLAALEAFVRESGRPLDALADEALRDLLMKHNQPLSLRDALRSSTRALPANDRTPPAKELKAGAKRSSRKA